MFDSKRGLLVAIVAVVVLGAAAATGGYLLGHSTGEDLDAARAAGTQEGQEAGSARGAEEGYAEGFKQGREEGYQETTPRPTRRRIARPSMRLA
jgi:hypothetical protein